MRQKRTAQGIDPNWLRSLLLAGCFLSGVLGGIFWADRVSGGISSELATYLQDYLALSDARGAEGLSNLWSQIRVYLRWPALAFLCGFTSAGLWLLPLGAAACGFFPAYAVACLADVFGGQGILLALVFFGVRSLVTIPCFFLLAVPSMETSAALFRVSFGRGHPFSPIYGKHWWLRFAAVCLFLCLGLCVDLWLSPFLLPRLLERVILF